MRWYQRLLYFLLNLLFSATKGSAFHHIDQHRNHYISLHFFHSVLDRTDYVAFMAAYGVPFPRAIQTLNEFRIMKKVTWSRFKRLVLCLLVLLVIVRGISLSLFILLFVAFLLLHLFTLDSGLRLCQQIQRIQESHQGDSIAGADWCGSQECHSL